MRARARIDLTPDLATIQQLAGAALVRFTDHAYERVMERVVSVGGLLGGLSNGPHLIQSYPKDRKGRRCCVGFVADGRELHCICAISAYVDYSEPLLVIITVFDPYEDRRRLT